MGLDISLADRTHLPIVYIYIAGPSTVRAGEAVENLLRTSIAGSTIVMGDFNLHSDAWENSAPTLFEHLQAQGLIDWAELHGLILLYVPSQHQLALPPPLKS
jgi:hypothetical protein